MEIDTELLEKFKKDLTNYDKKFVNYIMGECMKNNPKLDPKRTRELIIEKLKEI